MRRIIIQRDKTGWKNEKGLTFVEVMVAVLIVSLVGSSVLMSYNLAHRFARRNTNRTIAIQIAQAAIEQEKRQGFNGWVAPNSNPYLGTTGNMTTSITSTPVAVGVRRVGVIVSWTDRDRTVNETLQTLLTQR